MVSMKKSGSPDIVIAIQVTLIEVSLPVCVEHMWVRFMNNTNTCDEHAETPEVYCVS